MARFADNDTCPKCGKGRVLLENFPGNIGDNLWLRCYFSPGCDFAEYITDDDRW